MNKYRIKSEMLEKGIVAEYDKIHVYCDNDLPMTYVRVQVVYNNEYQEYYYNGSGKLTFIQGFGITPRDVLKMQELEPIIQQEMEL